LIAMLVAWGSFAFLVPIVPEPAASQLTRGATRAIAVSISYYLLGVGGTEWCNESSPTPICSYLWVQGRGP